MTSFDPGAFSNLTLAVRGDAMMTDALHHAVRRDLARLIRAVDAPVTTVRRGALINHTGYLLDQLQAHHRELDEVSWPGVVGVRPDLAEVASRVALAHDELTEPLRAARNSAVEWRTDPGRRLAVLSAVRELAAALSPVLAQDSDLAPLIDEVLSEEPARQPRRIRSWVGVPTRLARRTFWLLDELDSRQADLLAERTPRAVMWILRNGFSGAYNRSSYLMWVGGGSGPAA